MGNEYRPLAGNPSERGRLGELGAGGRKILKWSLKRRH
jgi:hypothetical protein